MSNGERDGVRIHPGDQGPWEWYTDRRPDDATLRATLATLLDTTEDQVLVGEGPSTLEAWTDQRFVCELLTDFAGDFPVLMLLYRAREATDGEPGFPSFIRRLAGALDLTCLVSDTSMDPFSWILVAPDGVVRHVHVDPEAMDRGELVITRRLDTTVEL